MIEKSFAATLALVVWLVAAASAAAAPPAFLLQSPEDGAPGAGAGRMSFPSGIAAQRSLPGHLYVADQANNRIDELTPWGEFVRAWGWGVDAAEPKEEPQSCTAAGSCGEGNAGGGAGQFTEPEAVAVDAAGSVYVLEASNHRVQKFDATGSFVLMFGAEVNKTKVEEGTASEAEENLCTAASGDVCQAGTKGSGPGQFNAGAFGYFNLIVADPASGNVFVGEGERIQVFDSGGALVEAIVGGDLAGRSLRALASGPGGELYAAFKGEAEVRRLAPGGPGGEFTGPSFAPEKPGVPPIGELPRALAVDGEGSLYVVLQFGGGPERVQKYDAGGECLTCGEDGEGGLGGFDRSEGVLQLRSIAASDACGPQLVYPTHFTAVAPAKSFLRAFGEAPDPEACPRPEVPPRINAQFAAGVETTGAEVAAQINPRFWDDTAYHLEYGTAPCREGGCTEETATRTLTDQVIAESLGTEPFALEGLAPGTTYHYRFVAESAGGGPVYGADPDGPEGPEEAGFEDGLEGSFTTYVPEEQGPCANDSFRQGAGGALADCRAYELVSPLDKASADIEVFASELTQLPAVLAQSATDGDGLAYGSYRAFGDAQSAPWTSQYVARRVAGEEWQSHGISPPRGHNLYDVVSQTHTEFQHFDSSLCEARVLTFAEGSLAAGAPPQQANLYRRTDEECGGPAYEALTTTPLPGAGEKLRLELQGVSADGLTTAFLADHPQAGEGTAGKVQLHGRRGIEARLLCVLPGGSKYSGDCTAGWTEEANFNAQEAQLSGALSEDGERVYWTAATGPGKIYLRERPFATGSECAGATAPCTKNVSKGGEDIEGTGSSQFWAAADDGTAAIYATGGTLYEYRRGDESTHEIAGEVDGVVGASKDLARVYLVSREAGGGANGRGEEAQAGRPNLYLAEGGGLRFIATLAAADLKDPEPTPTAGRLRFHFARVSPDGGAAAFMSAAPLSGYDNTGRNSGEALREVFLFRAAESGAAELVCASCNPSGARPAGASRIQPPENVLYASRMLSEDGDRLYFESYDSLRLRDTNGRRDVYQWEAPGAGTCKADSPTYSPAAAGCIDLISSGHSTLDSGFLDADPSGGDVFFTTLSSLLPQDYGLVDVYDARAGGGLPPPPGPPRLCEGEACQSPPPAPAPVPSASRGYRGPGNLSAPPASRCNRPARRAAALSGRARALRGAARRQARRGTPARARLLRRKAARSAAAARRQSKRARRCRARVRASRSTPTTTEQQ